jgi:phage terminase small subunit
MPMPCTPKQQLVEADATQAAARTEHVAVTQDWVIAQLREVVERCMEPEPVLDRAGNPTGGFTFNPTAANRALELIGKHLGMFKDKPDGKGALSHEDALTDLD